MRWIIDAQLPPALCDFLESQGHQAEHVMALKMGDAPDSIIDQQEPPRLCRGDSKSFTYTEVLHEFKV